MKELKFIKKIESEVLKAVESDGYALQYVKEQTEAICLKAVERNGYALRYVEIKSEKVYKIATYNKNEYGRAFGFICEKRKSYTLAELKIKIGEDFYLEGDNE